MKRYMMCFMMCFMVCCLFATQGMAADKVITLVSSPWEPYYGKGLLNDGLGAEIVRAVYKSQGYQVNFQLLPWKRCLEQVKNGDYYAAFNAYYSDERAEIYHYSDPYLQTPLVLFKRKGEPPLTWTTIEDLKPYRIGVMHGGAHTPEIDSATFLHKEEVATELLNLVKILKGRIDLTPLDAVVGNYLIEKHFPNDKEKFEIVSPPLDEGKQVYMIFSRKIPDVQEKIQAFNDGLKQIKANGTLQNIMAKYSLEK